MSVEAIVALIAFLSLVVTILGFVLHGLRQDSKTLWSEHNSFKEKVGDKYATKEYVQDHSNARHEVLVESLNNLGRELSEVKKDVESVEAQLRGSNELLPQLLLTLHQIQEKIRNED